MTSSPLRAVTARPLIVIATAFGSGGGASASGVVFSVVVTRGLHRGCELRLLALEAVDCSPPRRRDNPEPDLILGVVAGQPLRGFDRFRGCGGHSRATSDGDGDV